MTVSHILMFSLLRKLGFGLKRLWNDRRAVALIYVTATLPVIVGGALLAIDASRFYSLHTSLQKGTDALAIAGAAELDATPSAIARANFAITNIVNNSDVFSDAGQADAITMADVRVRYLTSIPNDDALPIPSSMVVSEDSSDPNFDANAAQKARFVEVLIEPRTLTAIFPASFLGGNNVHSTRSVSVAGNTQVLCRLMPLFICNPFEDPNHTSTDIYNDWGLFAAAESDAERRKLIEMKAAPGGDADYFPGDFGFLRTSGGQGAPPLADALAAGTAEACYSQSGVSTETGHKQGPIQAAFNTRFGIYQNPGFHTENGNPIYRPARNVRKAQTIGISKECEDWVPTAATVSQPLPKDDCFDLGNCTLMNGRMGNGVWSIDQPGEYWDVNYGTAAPGMVNGKLLANASRYDVYRHEIDTNMVGVPNPPTTVDNGDPKQESAPSNRCYSGPASSLTDSPDRRLINGAILNCKALANHPDYNLKGHTDNIPVLAFAEFFITQPLTGSCPSCPPGIKDRTLWTELRAILRQGNVDAVAFDQVQLYR